MHLQHWHFIYRMCAIITRGLHTFWRPKIFLISFFHKILTLSTVSIQERFIIKSGLWCFEYNMLIDKVAALLTDDPVGMLQHRSMHAATVWRAERISRACGWCARRAQSLLSNWSSRTQFYGAMPNFPTALRLLVVRWLWHTVAMDAQHTHQGKEDFQQQPAMGSGWKMLKLAQTCSFLFFLLHQLVTKKLKYSTCSIKL